MQAVIMTVYRDLKQVYELSNLLVEKFVVYIHVDKKVPVIDLERSGLLNLKNVFIYRKFRVNWGGKPSLEHFISDKRSIKK